MKKFIKEHNVKIILIIIILLQVLTIVFLGNQRIRLHMDEYLSYGFMNAEYMYMDKKEGFYTSWHNSEYFEEYLSVDENEKNNYKPVYENQEKDVHPPLFYFLLRIFANFNIGHFSIWTGIALNIVLFILSMYILYLIGTKLFRNKYHALLLCFIGGFTLGALQIAIFIRMYQLLSLMTLLLVYWHLCNKDKDDLNFIEMFQLLIIVILGFMTQYYFSIIVVALFIVNLIRKIKEKRFKLLFKYTLTLIMSVVISTIIFPAWINHVFIGHRGAEAFSTVLLIQDRLLIAFKKYLMHLNVTGFAGTLYLLIGFISVFGIGAICAKYKNKIKDKSRENTGISYIIFTVIFYFFIMLLVVPYIDLRYLSPIFLLIIILIVYYLIKFAEIIFEKRKNAFIIICIILLFITLINLLSICGPYNMFLYRENKNLIDEINNKSTEISCLYVVPTASWKIYETYDILLKCKQTKFIKYDENFLEDLIKVIDDKKINKKDILLVMDKKDYLESKTKLFENDVFMEFETFGKIGYMVFLKIQI